MSVRILATVLLAATGAFAQSPYLVRAIDGTSSPAPNARNLVNVNGTLYFTATDGLSGVELWRSDGTQTGTMMVKDICPGPCDSNPTSLVNVKGTLFFQANDGTNGAELWKSDGTAAGTVLVKDISPGSTGSSPDQLVVSNGILFFRANDASHGVEVWKSDGTSSGTVMVKDINPVAGGGSGPAYLTDLNGILYFQAADTMNGFELWRSDGTDSGTYLVKDIWSGNLSGSPDYIVAANGLLFFKASDGVNGVELWKSDGTAAGTVMVKDIVSGSGGSSVANLVGAGNAVYFQANDGINGLELWRSDGTSAGTSIVADIYPGTSGSSPRYVTPVGNLVFFVAWDGTHGDELWKTDGTVNGTALVKDIRPGGAAGFGYGTGYLTNVNGVLFFFANDGVNGSELWRSDGTAAGTTMVADLAPGISAMSPIEAVDVNGTLFFSASDGSGVGRLFKSDGTAAGTVLVKNIAPGLGATPTFLTALGNSILFSATENASGTELWKSDGTASGTTLVKDIMAGAGSSSPQILDVMNGSAFLWAADAVNGLELWKSDGTGPGTVFLKDIYPGINDGAPSHWIFTPWLYAPMSMVVNGTFYFAAGNYWTGLELWKSDGTSSGTVIVSDLNPGSGNSTPSFMAKLGSQLLLSANDGWYGQELWKVDAYGSPSLVKDINTASGQGSSPSYLTVVGSSVLFAAGDATNGTELWKSDGTSAGTVRVKDIAFSFLSSSPTGLTNVNGKLFFQANNQTNGAELWKSDGTDAGTVLVQDINPGSAGSAPTNITPLAGNSFVFAASDGTHGTELWKSDGNAASQVLDINPGSGSSYPGPMVNANGTVYFAATDASHGTELWKTDGTTTGTTLVADISMGPRGSNPANLLYVPATGTLYFTADDGHFGRQLWALKPGCGSSTSAPVITSSAESIVLCRGDSVTLSASGYASYGWSNGAAISSITVSPTAATTYAVTGFDGAGCPSQTAYISFDVWQPVSKVTVTAFGQTTFCSDGTGATLVANPIDGGAVTYQWGYRPNGVGVVTPMVGQTGQSYVLDGRDLPYGGYFFVSCAVTSRCGGTVVSNEIPVHNQFCGSASAPVQVFTATAANASVKLEWVNPPYGCDSAVVRYRVDGMYPTDPSDGYAVTSRPCSGGAKDSFVHAGLVNGQTYYYAVFTNAGPYYSGQLVAAARPFATPAAMRWVYSTGAAALTPPGVYNGAFCVSNDRVVHSTRAVGSGSWSSGGDWPAGYSPLLMNAPSQAHPSVVPTALIPPAAKVAFVASQDGSVYAVDADTGDQLWRSPTLGNSVQAAVSGIFKAFGGAYDYLFAATRNTSAANSLDALFVDSGNVYQQFLGDGDIGIISGQPSVDYANNRIYFASRARSGASSKTVWCVEMTDTGFVLVWAKPLGDVDASLTLSNGRLYVGTNAGEIHALDPATGNPLWSVPFATGDGPVKGFVSVDRHTNRLFFATTSKIWMIHDTGAGTSVGFSSTTVPGPSVPVFLIGDNNLLVGGSNGRLYQFAFGGGDTPAVTSVTLGNGLAAVGGLVVDINDQVYVGTDAGYVYAVAYPLP